MRAQIGYQVIGGTKFYERAEIRDAVAYLTFLANPQDAGAFTRVANSPQARARPDVAQPRAQPRGHDGRAGVGRGGGARERARRSAPRRRRRSGASCRRWCACASGPRPRRRSATCSTSCCARPATTTRSRPSGRSRRRGGSRTSRSSCASAREYDAIAEQGSVGEFLQQIALIADVDSLRDDEGLVTLMTLHNAKGLEFPIVFMIGMEDGVFPHSRAIDEGEIEEERRLAYVGLTRAMRDLTLTFARRRNSFGTSSFGMRSRFIDEIPRELTDQEDKAAVGAGWSPGRVASWSNAAAATAEAQPDTGGRVFRLGDDVVHAAFGEGVVTATRAGRDRRGALRRRRLGAQADGRLRADQETLTFPEGAALPWRDGPSRHLAHPPRRRGVRGGRGARPAAARRRRERAERRRRPAAQRAARPRRRRGARARRADARPRDRPVPVRAAQRRRRLRLRLLARAAARARRLADLRARHLRDRPRRRRGRCCCGSWGRSGWTRARA